MTVGDTIQSKNGAGLGGVVTSVNGETGPVDVTASSGVASVDGQTGVVVLSGTYLALAGGTLTGLLTATKGILVSPATSSSIGFAVVGLAGQTGNLTSWLDSSLATLASVNAAGVIAGAGFIVGSNASSTGGVRMPSLSAVNWRNAANNADIGGISTNASDQLQLGTTTVPDADNTKSLGASAKRWATVVTVALITGGTSPAVSGAVRLNNNTGMVGRNAANNADVAIIGINASDKAEVGTDLVGSSDALRTLGSSAVRWAGLHLANFVAVGTNPSSSGAVRLANNSGIASRNAANNADVSLLALNASDVATVGAPLTSTGEIIGTRFAPSTATGATAAARYFRATASGAPASGTWVTGDVVPAQDGTFWHCTAGGTPGTWVQSGSATYATKAATTDLVDAKGDRLLGSADNTLVRHAAPANGKFSVADSAQSDGWKDIDLPWHVSIDPIRVPAYSTVGGSIAAWGTYYQMANLNDEVVYNVQLGPGTWTFSCWRTIFTSYGILTVTLDGTTIATLDNYSGASVNPGQSLTTGISITAAGVYALKLKTTGKNASSSNYNQRLWSMDFTRTA